MHACLCHIKGSFGVTIFLLLVYTINLSLSTHLVDPPSIGTVYMKHSTSTFYSTILPFRQKELIHCADQFVIPRTKKSCYII